MTDETITVDADEQTQPVEPLDDYHTFHVSLFGTVWCDTCNSPYCELL